MTEESAALVDSKAIADCIAPLEQVIKEVETLSKQIPVEQEFHFLSNFSSFKTPVTNINARARGLLSLLGTSEGLRSEISDFPVDPEESYDWLVEVQDDVMEGLGSALDALGVGPGRGPRDFLLDKPKRSEKPVDEKGVKVARKRERPPVPFHVKSISRPQDKFDYPVDNSNQPFRHLSKQDVLGCPQVSNDGVSAIEMHAKRLGVSSGGHPLKEELESLTFAENLPENWEPIQPLALSQTPFTYVETVSSLQKMAEKLAETLEFAVDLENHHYRSFQGFVCLMQISTRSEDFIIDSLVLRDHIGPALRKIFANPAIRKVVHGADRDITWLQRDFGIYVCNMFDTGQAARVLRMEKFGLAHLLQTFCDVTPDKRYQLADWRLRPLTPDMLRYAREDTHYLLYIADKLKEILQDGQTSEDLYIEVCKRSRDVCLQLYQKELYVESSYHHLHGLREKNFEPEQLAIVAKLHSWRDKLCRQEDESTGYVLPNHLLLKLAELAPTEPKGLQDILKGNHRVASLHTVEILNIIREAKSSPLSLNTNTGGEHEVGEKKVPEVKSSQPSDKSCGTEKSVIVLGAASSMFTVMTASEPKRVNSALAMKKSSIGSALFSKPAYESSSDEETQTKLESVRASLVLPFQTCPVVVPEFQEEDFDDQPVSAGENGSKEREESTLDQREDNATSDRSEREEDSSGASEQTSTQEAAKELKNKRNGDELPLSLNERYGKKLKTQGRESARRSKSKTTKGKPAEALTLKHHTVANFTPTVKNFNPVGKIQEPDVHRGKKRQVFPRTGNRSGTFK